MKELIQIQNELNAPKSRTNNFGKYKYRSLEDIFEAVKPLLAKYEAVLNVTDELVQVNENMFVIKAVATITKGEQSFSSSSFAAVSNRKGMDIAQSFGASSSYARKYALSALFLLDDSKDIESRKPDTTPSEKSKPESKLPSFSPDHARWSGAIEALKKGQTTVQQIQSSFTITDEHLAILEQAQNKG